MHLMVKSFHTYIGIMMSLDFHVQPVSEDFYAHSHGFFVHLHEVFCTEKLNPKSKVKHNMMSAHERLKNGSENKKSHESFCVPFQFMR